MGLAYPGVVHVTPSSSVITCHRTGLSSSSSSALRDCLQSGLMALVKLAVCTRSSWSPTASLRVRLLGPTRAVQRTNKGSAKCQQGQCKGPTRAVQRANKGSAKGQQGQCKAPTRAVQSANKGSAKRMRVQPGIHRYTHCKIQPSTVWSGSKLIAIIITQCKIHCCIIQFKMRCYITVTKPCLHKTVIKQNKLSKHNVLLFCSFRRSLLLYLLLLLLGASSLQAGRRGAGGDGGGGGG